MEMRMEAAGRKQGEEEEEVMERNRIGLHVRDVVNGMQKRTGARGGG